MHWGWLAGLTIAFAITIGCISVSLTHTLGGKTKVTAAVTKGQVKVGKSTCIDFDAIGTQKKVLGCDPNSTKVLEDYQSLNISPADPLVASVNRSKDGYRLNVGAGKSVSDPTGWVKLSGSVTESFDGKDAVKIIDSNVAGWILAQQQRQQLRGLFASQEKARGPLFNEKFVIPDWDPKKKAEDATSHLLRNLEIQRTVNDFQRDRALQCLSKKTAICNLGG